eukprot:TRINITY_DN3390_c0_g2_i1.p1 TRINITY_DN3390_c0_g2~~TRINITY_DN3390_c0_g2_i1.p1  ORF type:complete len:241 (-),score=28.98 TRINITY_DN3390_c0_g2_i1:122-844(-)
MAAVSAQLRSSPQRSNSRGSGRSAECSSPEFDANGVPAPPPRQLRPPRPPGAQRPQPHIQGLKDAQASSRPGSNESATRPLSSGCEKSLRSRGQAPLDLDSGYPTPSTQQPSSSSSFGSLPQSQLPNNNSALGTSSAIGSSASTRTPSPGSAAKPGSAGSGVLSGLNSVSVSKSQSRPNSANAAGYGQVSAPIRWNWKPTDSDKQLRDSGQGAGHLKGRRSNLARIREIQGLDKKHSGEA